jgi:hypothetical protein
MNLNTIAEVKRPTSADQIAFAPLVSKVQAEFWGKPPYPPRTMFEVQRLFDDDIVEIDSISTPQERSERQSAFRSFIIAGLDPAIHLFAKKMDDPNSGSPEFGTLNAQVGYRLAMVKPAGDHVGL